MSTPNSDGLLNTKNSSAAYLSEKSRASTVTASSPEARDTDSFPSPSHPMVGILNVSNNNNNKNNSGKVGGNKTQNGTRAEIISEEDAPHHHGNNVMRKNSSHYSNYDGVADVPPSIRLNRRDAPQDIFSAHFLEHLREDSSELELTFSFRSSMTKISSVFAATRQEGLEEILQTISTLLMQAALEAHEKKMEKDTDSSDGTMLDVVLPFDVVRQELCRSHGFDYQYSSPTLDKAQRAISTIDYTTTLFHRILVARPEVRANMLLGMPIDVILGEEEALRWKPNLLPSKMAKATKPIITEGEGDLDEIALARSQHESFYSKLTDVSLREQEMALRVLQGMFITYNHQRKSAVDGPLIPYAVELLQCYLQHVTALYKKGEAARKNAVTDDLIEVGSFEVETGDKQAHHPLPLPMDDSTSAKDDHQPVTTEKGVTEIIVATVDALEALCHYNPAALTRLAQSGGVHALLNVLYPYYIPSMVRAAVLDVMSLLLQEVAPFRRMRPHEDNGGDIHNIFQQSIQQLSSTVYTCEGEDRLLQAMTLQALTGAYGSDGPPPYSMDRASASKFDSSAREWFSRKGLSHLVTSIMQLRTTKLMSPLDAEDGAGSRQRVTWLWEKRVKDLLVAIDEKSKKQ